MSVKTTDKNIKMELHENDWHNTQVLTDSGFLRILHILEKVLLTFSKTETLSLTFRQAHEIQNRSRFLETAAHSIKVIIFRLFSFFGLAVNVLNGCGILILIR